jgi:SAM-dependent methyltransferase
MTTVATPPLRGTEVRSWVNCRVCDSQRCSLYLEGRGYRVVKCLDCGLRYINPQPTDRELWDFYSDFDSHSTWRGNGEERFDRAVRKIISRYQPNGSVLDIGSSRGNFLLAMRRAGYTVYGVEPSQRNSEFARSVNHIETCTSSVEAFVAATTCSGFDVITMLNVLEHIKDPQAVLIRLRRLLTADGILVLIVPDAHLHAFVGRARKLLGFSDPFLMRPQSRPLVGFDPPAHVCSIEPRTITELIQKCGFKKVLLRNAPIIITRDTWKNLLKPIVFTCAQAIYYVSFARAVLGYSTVMVARKAA